MLWRVVEDTSKFYKKMSTFQSTQNTELNTYVQIKCLKNYSSIYSAEFSDFYLVLHIRIAINIILITCTYYKLLIMILNFRQKSLLKQRRKFQNGLRY